MGVKFSNATSGLIVISWPYQAGWKGPRVVQKSACFTFTFIFVSCLFSRGLSAETNLAAYRPLTPVQPSSSDSLLLAVESGADVVWSGGPAPWVDKPEGFFAKLEVGDESVIKAGPRLASR